MFVKVYPWPKTNCNYKSCQCLTLPLAAYYQVFFENHQTVRKGNWRFFSRAQWERPLIEREYIAQAVKKITPKAVKTGGTPANKRGFNFGNQTVCRYCPKINKTGKIKCSVTGRTYICMSNVSCRSSSLINNMLDKPVRDWKVGLFIIFMRLRKLIKQSQKANIFLAI